jgi:hypothetical protein
MFTRNPTAPKMPGIPQSVFSTDFVREISAAIQGSVAALAAVAGPKRIRYALLQGRHTPITVKA